MAAWDGLRSTAPPTAPERVTPPRARVALTVAGASVVGIVVTAWLAVRPGSQSAQTAFVLWVNDPPQPLGAVLAVSNPLLRPVPLAVVSLVLLGWAIVTVRPAVQRLTAVVVVAVALLLAEVLAQVLKRLAGQPRPAAVVPGLDTHGYPTVPRGNAYPSAHTALVVAAVCALWPWMSRGQRVAGVLLAVLVGLNRVYVGAHWPVDVLGGVAVGMLAGALTWLVARAVLVRRGSAARPG